MLALSALLVLGIRYGWLVPKITLVHWLLLGIFPLLGAAYYSGAWFRRPLSLRHVGWLKPIVIGLVWTGVVFIYPLLFTEWIHPERVSPSWFTALLFLKSVLYITLLAILFDAKDTRSDQAHQLKTWMVRMGKRRTLYILLLPLTLLGALTWMGYGLLSGASMWRMTWTLLPFVLLSLTIWDLQRDRNLLYYLLVVDGLMLVKACCGIVAML